MPEEIKYKIKLNSKTVCIVNGRQIFKPRWVEHFGSIEAINEFIKNYV